MTNSAIHTSAAERDRIRLSNKVKEHCRHYNENGEPIRGYVTRVMCFHCKNIRFDDGAPCKNPNCGGRTVVDIGNDGADY